MDLLHTEQLKNHFGQFYFTLKKIGIIRKSIFFFQKKNPEGDKKQEKYLVNSNLFFSHGRT